MGSTSHESNDKTHEELLIARLTDSIEKRVSDSESRRFKNLYIIIGFLSFIGIGVLSQLVDFYATRAVEVKLAEARQELESAKIFSQLLAITTRMDLADSFSHADRDAVVVLLEKARSNSRMRSEPIFGSVLEKIIDSLAASDNAMHVATVVNMYQDECQRSQGIAITLLQHFGQSYLAASDVKSKAAEEDFNNLSRYIIALNGRGAKGAGEAFYVLSVYKREGALATDSIRTRFSSLSALDDESKANFVRMIEKLSDSNKMAKRPTPETLRIAEFASEFRRTFRQELEALTP